MVASGPGDTSLPEFPLLEPQARLHGLLKLQPTLMNGEQAKNTLEAFREG